MGSMVGWGSRLVIAALVSPPRGEGPAQPRRFEFPRAAHGYGLPAYRSTRPTTPAPTGPCGGLRPDHALDQSFTDYDPESELMRLCDRAGGPPSRSSDDLFDILARSKAMYRAVRRRLRPLDRPGRPPLAAAPAATRSSPIPTCSARPWPASAPTRSRSTRGEPDRPPGRPGMKLDLGGIAKGYASHEAIKALKALGITRCLVAGSGDIAAGDPPPGRGRLEDRVAPLEAAGDVEAGAVHPAQECRRLDLGRRRAFVEIGGVRYSHVVDPKTGLGMTERGSVTVIAPDGITADGLDTAICVLGPDKGWA